MRIKENTIQHDNENDNDNDNDNHNDNDNDNEESSRTNRLVESSEPIVSYQSSGTNRFIRIVIKR